MSRKHTPHRNKVRFEIPGPLMGYRQTTRKTMMHPKERARSKAYGKWKTNVLYMALEAGFPNRGEARIDWRPRISVTVFWKAERPRIDWANVYKGVEDAIFYQDDCWVRPGKDQDVFTECEREYAEVVISF